MNLLPDKWKNGKITSNAWLTIPSAWTTELITHTGFESITIDMQHGPIGYQTAFSMLQIIPQDLVTPLVRVPWNDPAMIMKILDAGALGIICPMVNSGAEAEAFVGACRFAPQGYRSLGPLRSNLIYGNEYRTKANLEVLTFAMIETVEAMDNLVEIVSTPSLDGIYIGPMDLSLSLGIEDLGNKDNPQLAEAMQAIIQECKTHGKYVGTHSRGLEDIDLIKSWNVDMITSFNDSNGLLDAAKTITENLRLG